MATAAVDKLSKDLAFKANIDAVTRDYICEPRLGARPGAPRQHGVWDAFKTPWVSGGSECSCCCCCCCAAEAIDSSAAPRASVCYAARCASPPTNDRNLLLTWHPLARPPLLLPTHTEYRTVGGVSGPLVVVESVKVRGAGAGSADRRFCSHCAARSLSLRRLAPCAFALCMLTHCMHCTYLPFSTTPYHNPNTPIQPLPQKPKYSEIVNVRLGDGSVRKGQVLEVDGTRAVVQVRVWLV